LKNTAGKGEFQLCAARRTKPRSIIPVARKSPVRADIHGFAAALKAASERLLGLLHSFAEFGVASCGRSSDFHQRVSFSVKATQKPPARGALFRVSGGGGAVVPVTYVLAEEIIESIGFSRMRFYHILERQD